ncbi:MAG: hypothetical protein FWH21_10155, partial [Kiritimatiellaeota bacterium]|nr:hypothetical protein [Kiritimatiellota bacterium]
MKRKRRVQIILAVAVSAGVALAEGLDTARAALQDKLYPIAQRHAQQALEQTPNSHEALAILLESVCALNLAQEALDALDRYTDAQRLAPQPAVFTYWRAVALLKTGAP